MADPPGTPPASPLAPPDLPPPIEEGDKESAATSKVKSENETDETPTRTTRSSAATEAPTTRTTRSSAASSKKPAARKKPAAKKKGSSSAAKSKRDPPKRKTRGASKKAVGASKKTSAGRGANKKGGRGRKPSVAAATIPASAAVPGPFPLPPYVPPVLASPEALAASGLLAASSVPAAPDTPTPNRPGRPSRAVSRLSPAVVSALAKAHAAVLEVFSIHLDERHAANVAACKADGGGDPSSDGGEAAADSAGEETSGKKQSTAAAGVWAAIAAEDEEELNQLVNAAKPSFPWLGVEGLRLHRMQRRNWTGVADAARAAATAAAAERAVARQDGRDAAAATQQAVIVAAAEEAVAKKREEANRHIRCRAKALGEPIPESAKKKKTGKKKAAKAPGSEKRKRGRPRKLPLSRGDGEIENEAPTSSTPLKKRAKREDDEDESEDEDNYKSDEAFDRMLQKFIEFKEKGIHIPTKSPREMNLPSHPYHKLFKWTNRVRGQLLRIEEGGKSVRLTPEWARAALDAGIEDKRRGAHKTWEDRIIDLAKYKEENGHCHVPHSVQSLGMWCGHMRRLRRIQKGEGGGEGKGLSYGTEYLTPERVALLDGMGFVWDLKKSEHAPSTPRGRKAITPDKAAEAEREFEEMLQQLLAYKELKGDMRIPTRCAEMNEPSHEHHRLYKWAKKVRRQKVTLDDGRITTLTHEQVKTLEDVGFKFRLHTYIPWEERMESVRHFFNEHGHLSVPGDHPLARWCAHMRTLRRKMRNGEAPKSLYHDRDYLTPEREEELTNMGFVWELRDDEQRRALTPRKSETPKKRGPTTEEKAELERIEFSEMLVALREYCDEHGGPPSVARQPEFEKGARYHKIWQFCNKQRRERTALVKGEDTTMTRERFEALEGAGMRFAPAVPAKTWEERMEMCRAFRREHGHLCPPVSHPTIGTWTVKMRQLHNAGSLAPEKVRELDAMGFVWKLKGRRSGESKNKSWNERFADLEAWKAEHGHIRVPKSVSTLNGWLDHQKNEYNKMMRGDESRLTIEQAQRLKDIGVMLPPKKKTWAEHYEDLLRFKNRHGHISVPKTEPLHNWLHKEKKEFRRMVRGERTSMTVEKVEMLDSLGVFQHCRTKPDD